jgi:glycosyltransferase involved in cell wall biosynthesis
MTGYLAAPQRGSLPSPWERAPAPMRVATVITRLEGGAGQLALRGVQAVRGAQAAQDPGITPTIVTGSAGQLLETAAGCGIEVIIEPLLREVIAPASDLRALRRLETVFRDRSFDVVHTHCAKAGAVGRLAARRAGVGTIVHTYHGFPFHDFQSAARRRAYVTIERRLGRITDVALCVGTGVAAEAVRRELVTPERVRTIGVAVDGPGRDRASLNAFRPEARRQARERLGVPADATVVGSVGRLVYQKAPEDFVAALEHLSGGNAGPGDPRPEHRRVRGEPAVTGVWVGGGELAERVRQQAKRLPGVRVVLAGERADVLDILPAFDVFASASRYEGLPTALVEAMICGVPVVATAVNAVPDLVVPGETGLLVPPGRPARLAAAIRHLLGSPAAAARMAAAARDQVGDRYGLASLRSALIGAYSANVFDTVLAGSH